MPEESAESQVLVWHAGASEPECVPLSFEQLIGYLVSDWLPWVPEEARNSIFGWPEHLLDDSSGFLVIKKGSDKMERQWKGFFSWLLGVIGTRHLLDREDYQWIAHMSAFYEEAQTPAAIDGWNTDFPPSVLKACRPNPNKLRPDYIALRQSHESPSGYEWAVVEAKGTSDAVHTREDCRQDWKDQSENIELRLNEEELPVQRNLVVATRGDSGAQLPQTRRIQIRAWNQVRKDLFAPQEMVALVVAAHLFGLLKTFGAKRGAQALRNAVERWTHGEKLRQADEQTHRREAQEIFIPCDPRNSHRKYVARMGDEAWDLIDELIGANNFREAAELIPKYNLSKKDRSSSFGVLVSRLDV